MAALVSRRRVALPAGLATVCAPQKESSTEARLPRREHDATPSACDSESAGARPGDPGRGRRSRTSGRPRPPRGAALSPAPPPPRTQDFGLGKSSTSVACEARPACEISGSPRAPSGNVARGEHGGGLGHEWRLGVRAAERRASFCRSGAVNLAISCADPHNRSGARRLSDRPSDSERRQRPAARPLPLFRLRSSAGIGYPVARRRIRLVA